MFTSSGRAAVAKLGGSLPRAERSPRPELAMAGPSALASAGRFSTPSLASPDTEVRSDVGVLQKLSRSVAQACGAQARRTLPDAVAAPSPWPVHAVQASPVAREDVRVAPSACVMEIDSAWRVLSVSPDAADWLGVAQEELLGIDPRERFDVPAALVEAVGLTLATGRPAAVTVPAARHAGRLVEFEVERTRKGARIRLQDITERWRDERRHQAPRERPSVEPLPEITMAEIVLLDQDGVVASVNDAWTATFGETLAGQVEPVGTSYLEICRQVVEDLDEAPLRLGLKDLAAGASHGFTQLYRFRTRDGLQWRQVRITPMHMDGVVRLIVIHSDPTEVARAYAAARAAAEEVEKAQQQERQRIAIELHDSTSQHLIALSLGILRLRRIVGASAQDVLEDMSNSVQEAVREVRVLSYLMKPHGLDREGLERTARGFVTGFGLRTGLHVSFRAEGSVDTASPDVRHAAFRIVQEALANVYRHARANGVEVELACRDERLSVRIADDGDGIPALRDGRLQTAQLGVGVSGMQERVDQLGGEFAIASDEAGTVVTAVFPVAA